MSNEEDRIYYGLADLVPESFKKRLAATLAKDMRIVAEAEKRLPCRLHGALVPCRRCADQEALIMSIRERTAKELARVENARASAVALAKQLRSSVEEPMPAWLKNSCKPAIPPVCPPTCNPATPCGIEGCKAAAHLRVEREVEDVLGTRELDRLEAARWRRDSVYRPSTSGLGSLACTTMYRMR